MFYLGRCRAIFFTCIWRRCIGTVYPIEMMGQSSTILECSVAYSACIGDTTREHGSERVRQEWRDVGDKNG